MSLSGRAARLLFAAALLLGLAAGVATRPAAAAAVDATSGRSAASTFAVRGALAPAAPAFRAWLGARIGRLSFVPGVRGFGRIPSPLAAPTIQPGARVLAAAQAVAGAYPSSYDLSTLTPARDAVVDNQRPFGTCWAFATIGSLESNLLPAETWDFSEDNVILNSGFDNGGDPYNYGGWAVWTAAYLLRWGGPVAAAQDAYGDRVTPAGLSPAKHLQQWIRLPQPPTPAANDVVKAALVTYGAVDASMYWADSSYNSDAVPAYYYAGRQEANHEIDIVGWDDDYPRANFVTTPAGDGAYLCRNSWGTSFGRSGYFWVSYYDRLIATDMDLFPAAQPAGDYSRIYQYDPLGETDDFGFASTTGWMASRFAAVADESLAAAGIWVPSGNASYTVYGGTSLDALTPLASGTAAYAGYQTVTLPTPVSLTGGSPFVVAVKMTTPGYDYPIPVEFPWANYSSGATAAAGQSYVSATGTTWTDMTTLKVGTNVCLKAYATTAAGTDLLAPLTTVRAVDAQWHRAPVTLAFNVVDNGLGVPVTQSRVDGGAWQDGASVTVPAPAGGAGDGVRTVTYRSTDAAGNVEPDRQCTVRIDTVGPTGTVTLAAGAVRSGRRVPVTLRVADARSAQAHVVLVVRRRNGRQVKSVDLGLQTVGAPLSYRLRCDFGRGRFVVTLGRATADLAGNQLRAATGRRLIVVR